MLRMMVSSVLRLSREGNKGKAFHISLQEKVLSVGYALIFWVNQGDSMVVKIFARDY